MVMFPLSLNTCRLRLELLKLRAFFEQLCPFGAGLFCGRQCRWLSILIIGQNIAAKICRDSGKLALRQLVEELVVGEVGAQVLARRDRRAEIYILVWQIETAGIHAREQR